MENDHKVIEMVKHGFDKNRVYMATEDELRAKGWQPNHDHIDNLEIGDVVDEDAKPFSEAVVGWDAKGNDAWVSEKAYPPTTTIRIKTKKART
jgi:hypothetical protein